MSKKEIVVYLPRSIKHIINEKYIIHNGHKLKTSYILDIIFDILENYYYKQHRLYIRHSLDLKKIYGTYYKYYLEYLTDNNFIELYLNYSNYVGSKRCKTYKIKNELIDNIDATIVKRDDKLYYKKQLTNNFSPRHISYNVRRKLEKEMHNINLDYDASIAWLNANRSNITEQKYIHNTMAIEKIRINDLYGKFNTDNRFYSNFTNLKREIRQNYLYSNRHKLKEIDISNSQPLFLYLHMKSRNRQSTKYMHDVITGRIYDKISELSHHTRKESKTETFKTLFGKGGIWKKHIKTFNELYPDVYDYIKQMKINYRKYSILSDILKIIESRFMFQYFLPQMLIKYPDITFITVHDSIMVEDIYYDEVKEIFDKCLHDVLDNPELICYDL